jgi:hypothetical protein
VVGIAADPARAFAVLLHGAMLGFTVVCGIVALLVERVEIGTDGLTVRLRVDGLTGLARELQTGDIGEAA